MDAQDREIQRRKNSIAAAFGGKTVPLDGDESQAAPPPMHEGDDNSPFAAIKRALGYGTKTPLADPSDSAQPDPASNYGDDLLKSIGRKNQQK